MPTRLGLLIRLGGYQAFVRDSQATPSVDALGLRGLLVVLVIPVLSVVAYFWVDGVLDGVLAGVLDLDAENQERVQAALTLLVLPAMLGVAAARLTGASR